MFLARATDELSRSCNHLALVLINQKEGGKREAYYGAAIKRDRD
jgi:hypothetical protein